MLTRKRQQQNWKRALCSTLKGQVSNSLSLAVDHAGRWVRTGIEHKQAAAQQACAAGESMGVCADTADTAGGSIALMGMGQQRRIPCISPEIRQPDSVV